MMDSVGHYARPELLSLRVNLEPATPMKPASIAPAEPPWPPAGAAGEAGDVHTVLVGEVAAAAAG
jgi:hypothetical protein